MDIESNQLASAMLALVFGAVMLVTGLLFIERSGSHVDTLINANSVLSADDVFTRDGFMRQRRAAAEGSVASSIGRPPQTTKATPALRGWHIGIYPASRPRNERASRSTQPMTPGRVSCVLMYSDSPPSSFYLPVAPGCTVEFEDGATMPVFVLPRFPTALLSVLDDPGVPAGPRLFPVVP